MIIELHSSSRTPQPPKKGNTLELVGAPIRREKPTNRPQTNEGRNKPLMPNTKAFFHKIKYSGQTPQSKIKDFRRWAKNCWGN